MQSSQESGLGDQHLIYFQDRRQAYSRVAGGWPPHINSEAELKDAQQSMIEDLKRLENYLQVNRESRAAIECYGDLLRMAHNLGIPNAAGLADQVLSAVVAEEPNNHDARVALASLYVTLHQSLAPKAEAHFNRALELKSSVQNPLIFQGLGLACMYQGKWQEAQVHFSKYLDMVPADGRISQLQQNLIEGRYPELVNVPLPSSAVRSGDKAHSEQAQEKRKPWWRLW